MPAAGWCNWPGRVGSRTLRNGDPGFDLRNVIVMQTSLADPQSERADDVGRVIHSGLEKIGAAIVFFTLTYSEGAETVHLFGNAVSPRIDPGWIP